MRCQIARLSMYNRDIQAHPNQVFVPFGRNLQTLWPTVRVPKGGEHYVNCSLVLVKMIGHFQCFTGKRNHHVKTSGAISAAPSTLHIRVHLRNLLNLENIPERARMARIA